MYIRSFAKIRGTFLGVLITRTIVLRGLYWGPPILGNYHVYVYVYVYVLVCVHGLPWEMFNMRGPRGIEVEGTTSDALSPLPGYLSSSCPLGPPWPQIQCMSWSWGKSFYRIECTKGFLPVKQPKASRAPKSTAQTLNPKPSTLNSKP